MSASLPSFHVLVLVFLVLCTIGGVYSCSVTPLSAAVVAGDDLSLTCTTQNKSQYVQSWRLESDTNTALALYKARSLAPDGGIMEERKVADGYLVNDSNTNIQVVLTIVKASTVQANYYYCLCSGSTSAFAYVSVLASEPTFSNTTEIIDGEPVNFTCSVSFNGAANTSIIIEDSFGNPLIAKNYDGTSKGLHSFSLDYSATANSRVYQGYVCNISLSNDTSNTVIYSRKLNSSVQWVSVRNVQITPIVGTQCKDGEQCSINQTIRCTAKGNPIPGAFQWVTSVNESGFTKTGTSGDQFTFTNTGRYKVQCFAFNDILDINYNDSSNIFETEVIMEQLNYPTSGEKNSAGNNNTALIVGLVVGLGGGLIVIIVSVIVVFIWKRKKRGTVCCNPDGNNQSVELHKTDTASKTKDNGVKKNGHTTQGVLNKGSDDVTVVENDLYSREQNAKKIDPSDGGYAAINEVMPHGR